MLAMEKRLMNFKLWMAMQDWTKNTIYTYYLFIKSFLKEHGSVSLSEFSAGDARQYYDKLRENLSRKSTKCRLMALKAFWRSLGFNEYVWKIKIIPERRIPKYLSVEEINKLLDSITPKNIYSIRDRAMYELIYAAGLKNYEISNLKLNDINIHEKKIYINGEPSYFGDRAAVALQEYIQHRKELLPKTDLLFINPQGNKISKRRIELRLKRYAKKAEIPPDKVTPTALRNSLAVHLLNNGANLKIVQNILRYKQVSHVWKYVELTTSFQKVMKEAVNAIV